LDYPAAMISLFAAIVTVILNLVPADVAQFQLVTANGETILFTRQSGNTWQGVEQPAKDLGTFRVDGLKLRQKVAGKESLRDFTPMVAWDAAAGYERLQQFQIADKVFQVRRGENGFDFVLSSKSSNRTEDRVWQVRWEAPAKK
jgi:hypothetical protein